MHDLSLGDIVAYELIDRAGKWRWTLGVVTDHPHNETYRLTQVENWKRKPRELTEEERKKADAIVVQIKHKQDDAEEKRLQAYATAQEIRAKAALVEAQRKDADETMAKAKKQLDEARTAVLMIEEAHMREIRSYRTPPATVRLVLDAVLSAISNNKYSGDKSTWDTVLTKIRDKNFQETVAAFDATDLSNEAANTVMRYLKDEKFTHDAAMKASKATGPLFLWVAAQGSTISANNEIRRMKNTVKDIEIELQRLNELAKQNAEDLKAVLAEIAKLQQRHDDLMSDDLNVLRGLAMGMGLDGSINNASFAGIANSHSMTMEASANMIPNVWIENDKPSHEISILTVSIFERVTNEVTRGVEHDPKEGKESGATRPTMSVPFPTLMRLQCKFEERQQEMVIKSSLDDAYDEMAQMRKALKERDDEVATLKKEIEDLKTDHRKVSSALDSATKKNTELEALSTEKDKTAAAALAELETLRQDFDAAQDAAALNAEEIHRLQRELEAVSVEAGESKANFDAKEGELSEQFAENAALAKRISDLNEILARNDAEVLAAAQQEAEAKDARIAVLEDAIANKDAAIDESVAVTKALEDEIDFNRGVLEGKVDEVKALLAQLAESSKQVESLSEESRRSQTLAAVRDGENETLKTVIEEAQHKIARLNEELQSLNSSADATDAELRAMREEAATKDALLAEKDAENESLKDAIEMDQRNIGSLTEELGALRGKTDATHTELAILRDEAAVKDALLDEKDAALADLKANVSRLSDALDLNNASLNTMQSQLQVQEATIEELSATAAEQQRLAAEKDDSFTRLESQLAALQKELEAKGDTIDALEVALERTEDAAKKSLAAATAQHADECAALSAQLAQLTRSLSSKAEALSAAEASHGKAIAEAADAHEAQLKKAAKDHTAISMGLQKALDEAKQTIERLREEAQSVAISNDAAAAQQDAIIAGLQQDLAALRGSNDRHASDKRALERAKSELELRHTRSEAQLQSLARGQKDSESALADKQSDVDELKRLVAVHKRSVDDANADCEALRDRAKEAERAAAAVARKAEVDVAELAAAVARLERERGALIDENALAMAHLSSEHRKKVAEMEVQAISKAHAIESLSRELSAMQSGSITKPAADALQLKVKLLEEELSEQSKDMAAQRKMEDSLRSQVDAAHRQLNESLAASARSERDAAAAVKSLKEAIQQLERQLTERDAALAGFERDLCASLSTSEEDKARFESRVRGLEAERDGLAAQVKYLSEQQSAGAKANADLEEALAEAQRCIASLEEDHAAQMEGMTKAVADADGADEEEEELQTDQGYNHTTTEEVIVPSGSFVPAEADVTCLVTTACAGSYTATAVVDASTAEIVFSFKHTARRPRNSRLRPTGDRVHTSTLGECRVALCDELQKEIRSLTHDLLQCAADGEEGDASAARGAAALGAQQACLARIIPRKIVSTMVVDDDNEEGVNITNDYPDDDDAAIAGDGVYYDEDGNISFITNAKHRRVKSAFTFAVALVTLTNACYVAQVKVTVGVDGGGFSPMFVASSPMSPIMSPLSDASSGMPAIGGPHRAAVGGSIVLSTSIHQLFGNYDDDGSEALSFTDASFITPQTLLLTSPHHGVQLWCVGGVGNGAVDSPFVPIASSAPRTIVVPKGASKRSAGPNAGASSPFATPASPAVGSVQSPAPYYGDGALVPAAPNNNDLIAYYPYQHACNGAAVLTVNDVHDLVDRSEPLVPYFMADLAVAAAGDGDDADDASSDSSPQLTEVHWACVVPQLSGATTAHDQCLRDGARTMHVMTVGRHGHTALLRIEVPATEEDVDGVVVPPLRGASIALVKRSKLPCDQVAGFLRLTSNGSNDHQTLVKASSLEFAMGERSAGGSDDDDSASPRELYCFVKGLVDALEDVPVPVEVEVEEDVECEEDVEIEEEVVEVATQFPLPPHALDDSATIAPATAASSESKPTAASSSSASAAPAARHVDPSLLASLKAFAASNAASGATDALLQPYGDGDDDDEILGVNDGDAHQNAEGGGARRGPMDVAQLLALNNRSDVVASDGPPPPPSLTPPPAAATSVSQSGKFYSVSSNFLLASSTKGDGEEGRELGVGEAEEGSTDDAIITFGGNTSATDADDFFSRLKRDLEGRSSSLSAALPRHVASSQEGLEAELYRISAAPLNAVKAELDAARARRNKTRVMTRPVEVEEEESAEAKQKKKRDAELLNFLDDLDAEDADGLEDGAEATGSGKSAAAITLENDLTESLMKELLIGGNNRAGKKVPFILSSSATGDGDGNADPLAALGRILPSTFLLGSNAVKNSNGGATIAAMAASSASPHVTFASPVVSDEQQQHQSEAKRSSSVVTSLLPACTTTPATKTLTRRIAKQKVSRRVLVRKTVMVTERRMVKAERTLCVAVTFDTADGDPMGSTIAFGSQYHACNDNGVVDESFIASLARAADKGELALSTHVERYNSSGMSRVKTGHTNPPSSAVEQCLSVRVTVGGESAASPLIALAKIGLSDAPRGIHRHRSFGASSPSSPSPSSPSSPRGCRGAASNRRVVLRPEGVSFYQPMLLQPNAPIPLTFAVAVVASVQLNNKTDKDARPAGVTATSTSSSSSWCRDLAAKWGCPPPQFVPTSALALYTMVGLRRGALGCMAPTDEEELAFRNAAAGPAGDRFGPQIRIAALPTASPTTFALSDIANSLTIAQRRALALMATCEVCDAYHSDEHVHEAESAIEALQQAAEEQNAAINQLNSTKAAGEAALAKSAGVVESQRRSLAHAQQLADATNQRLAESEAGRSTLSNTVTALRDAHAACEERLAAMQQALGRCEAALEEAICDSEAQRKRACELEIVAATAAAKLSNNDEQLLLEESIAASKRLPTPQRVPESPDEVADTREGSPTISSAKAFGGGGYVHPDTRKSSAALMDGLLSPPLRAATDRTRLLAPAADRSDCFAETDDDDDGQGDDESRHAAPPQGDYESPHPSYRGARADEYSAGNDATPPSYVHNNHDFSMASYGVMREPSASPIATPSGNHCAGRPAVANANATMADNTRDHHHQYHQTDDLTVLQGLEDRIVNRITAHLRAADGGSESPVQRYGGASRSASVNRGGFYYER